MTRTWPLICLFILGVPQNSSAQDDPQVGLVVGYPSTVGVLWQVTDRIALRPDVAWTRTSFETTLTFTAGFPPLTPSSTTSVTSTSKSQNTAFGMSGLLTVSRVDALRLYVGGRGAYNRSTTTTTSFEFASVAGVSTRERKDRSTGYSVSGFFGGQFALHRRFAVFGEVGIAYQTLETVFIDDADPVDSAGNNSGARSGVGIILFF